MKKIFLISLLATGLCVAKAQLPNYSIAKDFSLYAINQTTGALNMDAPVRLYDYLDSGKTTVIDFSAYWCAPCWSYHNGGALESLYETYGPEGTNEMRAIFIEGDNASLAQLQGTGTGTQGNWLAANTPYPFIPTGISPNTNTVVSNYAIGYWPTVYLICPNRITFNVGQSTAANLHNYAQTLCPQYNASLANNGLILYSSNINENYFCASPTVSPKIFFQNVGADTVTSVKFNITVNGTTSDYTWSGNLARYATSTISMPVLENMTSAVYTYKVEVVEINGVADTDPSFNSTEAHFTVQEEPLYSTLTEDFTGATFPPAYYGTTNGLWMQKNEAIVFNAYSLSNGASDEFVLPLLNFSDMNSPVLEFNVAHARYSTSNDKLQVLISTNCGASWNTVYNKGGAALATAPTSAASFTPNSSQWRTETVTLTSYASKDDVLIKLKAISNNGNNIWLDHIVVANGTGIESNDLAGEISIYPNPAVDKLYIKSDVTINQIDIVSIQGQVISSEQMINNEINVNTLATGVYMLRIYTEQGVAIKKFVKE